MSERKLVKSCRDTGIMLEAGPVDSAGVKAGCQGLDIPHNRETHKAVAEGKHHWRPVRWNCKGFLYRDIVPG